MLLNRGDKQMAKPFYIVSDKDRNYRISGIFVGPHAKEAAIRWAGEVGHITRATSSRALRELSNGKTLPKRYVRAA